MFVSGEPSEDLREKHKWIKTKFDVAAPRLPLGILEDCNILRMSLSHHSRRIHVAKIIIAVIMKLTRLWEIAMRVVPAGFWRRQDHAKVARCGSRQETLSIWRWFLPALKFWWMCVVLLCTLYWTKKACFHTGYVIRAIRGGRSVRRFTQICQFLSHLLFQGLCLAANLSLMVLDN
jgi:hypothetical protein